MTRREWRVPQGVSYCFLCCCCRLNLRGWVQVQPIDVANPASTLHQVGQLGANADLFFGRHRGDEFNELIRGHGCPPVENDEARIPQLHLRAPVALACPVAAGHRCADGLGFYPLFGGERYWRRTGQLTNALIKSKPAQRERISGVSMNVC